MGRTDAGDDATDGSDMELPRHQVTLSAYQIGKYEVTNGQFCAVLNWAKGKGYLQNSNGGAYDGGDIYFGGKVFFRIDGSYCQFLYSSGVFSWKTRGGKGGMNYSMENHPVDPITWWGAVAFCNWLSEMDGKIPAYDLATWALVDANPSLAGIQFTNGYRLPTEAEWERAAAWDGSKHWIYSFISDTLTDSTRCNAWIGGGNANPLGLTTKPFTSPVGWFNGKNISPNGNIQTVDSPSPVGCYDMSGNVSEWCHDWYDYYGSGAQTNPVGPDVGFTFGGWIGGPLRVLRGGEWTLDHVVSRSSFREYPYFEEGVEPGFRVARTP